MLSEVLSETLSEMLSETLKSENIEKTRKKACLDGRTRSLPKRVEQTRRTFLGDVRRAIIGRSAENNPSEAVRKSS